MTPAKGKFKPGQAYVAFSRVRTIDKLHIINYTQNHIHVSEHVEAEMKRLGKNTLPQMPSNIFQTIPGGLKLLHINIGNLKTKIADIKNDTIFQNADIIALNETHLGHRDTLTPQMIGVSQDRFIVHCDCNNKGGGVALIIKTNLKPKHIRINTILEILVVEISEPIHMIVISLYRPPSTPRDVFINNMLHIITQFQNIPICIVGDFNEDVSITSNTHSCTTLRLQGFQQMISKPTHDSGTIIDHVYVSHTLNKIQTDITDCYYNDHDCIQCVITV